MWVVGDIASILNVAINELSGQLHVPASHHQQKPPVPTKEAVWPQVSAGTLYITGSKYITSLYRTSK
jgi:hypothetical protein